MKLRKVGSVLCTIEKWHCREKTVPSAVNNVERAEGLCRGRACTECWAQRKVNQLHKDMTFLIEKGIVTNFLGSDEEVSEYNGITALF